MVQHLLLPLFNKELLFFALLGASAAGTITFSMHKKSKKLFLIDMLFGITGALVAGILANTFHVTVLFGLYDERTVIAIVGAGILIWLGRVRVT